MNKGWHIDLWRFIHTPKMESLHQKTKKLCPRHEMSQIWYDYVEVRRRYGTDMNQHRLIPIHPNELECLLVIHPCAKYGMNNENPNILTWVKDQDHLKVNNVPDTLSNGNSSTYPKWKAYIKKTKKLCLDTNPC